MAINFPANPSNGDVHAGFTYNSTKSVWEANSPSMMATSDTAPTSPSDGQMWFDTDGGGTFVYYEDADSSQWVEVIGSQGSPGADGAAGADGGAGVASVYATVDNLPTSGNSQGDMAHVTANNTLYFWNGSGWYKIALINTNPSISGVSSSYSLAIDGTATVVTVTASDPEGLPITYSIASDTSGNIATVTQGTGASSNVFTVTPSTSQADAGSFTLTFRASDGVNLATAPASFTLQFSVENSNYTTALITSEGANLADNNDFVDSSTNSHTITAAGNATQTTFSPYRHGGYSTYFDGSGDYMSIADNANMELGSSSFTVEAYFYQPSTSGIQVILSKWAASSYPFLFYTNSGTAYFAVNNSLYGSGGTVIANQWNHMAVTRNGNDWNLWLNGTSVYNTTNSLTVNNDGTAWNIGRNPDGGGVQYFTGYITDLRMVKGTALYTSAFTPPTERLTAITNTSLLACHLPYIADGSTNAHSITVNGNTSTQPFAPYDYSTPYTAGTHGGSIHVDGTGDYVSITDHADLDMGTSDFTIEGWYYPNTTPGGSNGLLSKRANGAEANGILIYFGGSSNGTPHLLVAQSGSWSINSASSITFKTGQWNHFAIVRNGTSFKLYINGKTGISVTSSITVTDNSHPFVIGAMGADGSNTLANSNIADFRVVKGTAVYTAEFTPPTSPLTAITNTSLLIQSTNAGIIDKSQTSSALVLDGDTKCSSTQTKYRSTAIYTDGTGDRVRFGINNKKLVCDWGVGGEPFTVEWWMYDTQPYTTQHSFGPQTGGGAGAWNASTGHQWITYWNNSVLNIYYYGTNGNYSGNTCTAAQLGIVQNQWQHVAHTYDGTTWRLYVDGVHGFHWVLPVQPASVSGTFAALGSFAEPAYYNAAYYDDVRITKGLARYTGTSSFTPPAAALKG